MPTRSPGCFTCRKRKVRCDETRPGCRRCATHGVPCPGYRDDKPNGIEFKDQTSVTVRRAKDIYKAKALNSPVSGKSSDSSSTSSGSDRLYDEAFTPFAFASDAGSPPCYNEDITGSQAMILSNHFNNKATPLSLHSPSLERMQLYNEFITSYLPQNQRGVVYGHFSFLQTLAFKTSCHPALTQGLDAISLVQIGSLYKHQSLTKQGVHEYAKALSSLARSIFRGEFLYDDDVLAAVTVLAMCELYAEIQDMGEGWAKHVNGCSQLLIARGPASMTSELSLLLYSNMRHGVLLYALMGRREPFMAKAEWREVNLRVPLAVLDESTGFFLAALQVPGLLQRRDELDSEADGVVEQLDKILEDSSALEAALGEWYANWHDHHTSKQMAYELRPIEEFATFALLCPDRGFTHAFRFSDYLIAYLYSMYWLVIDHLRANTQSLQKLRHQLVEDWYPEPEEAVLEDEILDYVLKLCQCIPYFIEPSSGPTGDINMFVPMRTAAFYFREHGHWKWLKWIGCVRDNAFVRGLSPPARPTTPVISNIDKPPIGMNQLPARPALAG